MHIYLMRHGQTDWNIVHRMQGRSDIPLNATGLKQAKTAAHGMDKLPIDRILTSPLRRARQTAQAVAVGRGIPVLVEEGIVEMAFGALEGQLLSDFPACECIFSDPEHYVPLEGGESYAQLDVRCRKLLEEILPPLEGRAGQPRGLYPGRSVPGAWSAAEGLLGRVAPAQLLLHRTGAEERRLHPRRGRACLRLNAAEKPLLFPLIMIY